MAARPFETSPGARPMIRLAAVGGRAQIGLVQLEHWHRREFDFWRACGEAEHAAGEQHLGEGHLRAARAAFVSADDAFRRALAHYRAATTLREALRVDQRQVPVRTVGGPPCAVSS